MISHGRWKFTLGLQILRFHNSCRWENPNWYKPTGEMNSGALQSPHDCSNAIGSWGTNRIQMDFGAEAGFLWLDFQGKTELCSGWNYQLLFLGFGNIWNTFVTRCKFTSWNIGILPPTELYWPLSLGAAAKSKLWTSAGHFLVCFGEDLRSMYWLLSRRPKHGEWESFRINTGVCLKIVYPYTQWLMIIIPTKWL